MGLIYANGHPLPPGGIGPAIEGALASLYGPGVSAFGGPGPGKPPRRSSRSIRTSLAARDRAAGPRQAPQPRPRYDSRYPVGRPHSTEERTIKRALASLWLDEPPRTAL